MYVHMYIVACIYLKLQPVYTVDLVQKSVCSETGFSLLSRIPIYLLTYIPDKFRTIITLGYSILSIIIIQLYNFGKLLPSPFALSFASSLSP